MLEILKSLQADMSGLRKDVVSLSVRVTSIEEHMRGVMTSIYGMQSDVADVRTRVDRIERRLGLADTEH